LSPRLQNAAEWEGRGPACRSPQWLERSLAEILGVALRETGATSAAIREAGLADVRVQRELPAGASRPLLQLVASAGAASASQVYCAPAPAPKRDLGPIALAFEDPSAVLAPAPDRCQALARMAALLVRRRQLHMRAARHCGVDLSGIVLGMSDALRRLEEAIEKIAQADLPAVIEAEFGSDELAVAAAVHCLSARQTGPFVVLRGACQKAATFRHNLCAAADAADGGTLFLNEVDLLDTGMQKDLLSVLSSAEGPDGAVRNPRLLAASSRPLQQLVGEGRFCRLVSGQLGLLRIQVPPLRARLADIRPLVEYEVAERLNSAKRLLEEAWPLCEQYQWPENLDELRQVAARLVVMSDGERISLEDLAVHTPSVARASAHAELAPPAASNPGDPVPDLAPDPELDGGTSNGLRAIEDLARRLAAGNLAGLAQYGLGLERALTYVSRRYQADISLGELSQKAYLSPSHLSFLFKKTLGVPFKALLAAVRIEMAKELLCRDPELSVTDVSLDVGFGDLSHFEKTFKRIVGVNPREYRRRQRAMTASRTARKTPGTQGHPVECKVVNQWGRNSAGAGK